MLRNRSKPNPNPTSQIPLKANPNPPQPFPTPTLWPLLLLFRVANALLLSTYFDPDEHWQALEVAHRVAFGYGHLTWEWKAGIRSYLHPLLFASLYKVLGLLGLDTPLFMIRAPRILQAVLSSIGDLYLYKLSQRVFNEHVARWALFCQLTNWFMFFCIPRTYSNCLETVLTTVGLYYWFAFSTPTKQCKTTSRKLGLLVAALACALRPTSAIIWLYVGVLKLISSNNWMDFLLLEVMPIGAFVVSLSCLLDRWMYGSWVIVPLNFLKFNFLSSGGDFYGTHVWHWYFTQGFPVMVFTFLPLSLHGIYKSKEWKFSGLIVWVLGVYSILGHKEFRFVLPMLPIALMFSGYSLAKMSSSNMDKHSLYNRSKWCSVRAVTVLLLVITNLPVALYTGLIHQRGREEVMNFLANEAHTGNVKSILFLTPCHATPYYSTLHRNLPMRFLDCSPGDGNRALTESDRFKMDPVSFVSQMASNWSTSSHIVLFNHEEQKLRGLLLSNSYSEVKKFFNAHFPVDDVLQAYIYLYARQDSQ